MSVQECCICHKTVYCQKLGNCEHLLHLDCISKMEHLKCPLCLSHNSKYTHISRYTIRDLLCRRGLEVEKIKELKTHQ